MLCSLFHDPQSQRAQGSPRDREEQSHLLCPATEQCLFQGTSCQLERPSGGLEAQGTRTTPLSGRAAGGGFAKTTRSERSPGGAACPCSVAWVSFRISASALMRHELVAPPTAASQDSCQPTRGRPAWTLASDKTEAALRGLGQREEVHPDTSSTYCCHLTWFKGAGDSAPALSDSWKMKVTSLHARPRGEF